MNSNNIPSETVKVVDTFFGKCDNCCCSLLDDQSENLGIRKLKIKGSLFDDISEIKLWNALEFIYGVSWDELQNYNLENSSSLWNSQENMKYCNNCASLLSENYNAHQNFENTSHPSSLVVLLKAFRSKRISLPQVCPPYDYESPTENDTDTERDVKENLFHDFTFNVPEDNLIASQEDEETKYDPPTTLSQNNAIFPRYSESSETTTTRRTSLRPRQLVIKADKLSPEEILQHTAKRGSKKTPARSKKFTSVKNPDRITNRPKQTRDDSLQSHQVEKSVRKREKKRSVRIKRTSEDVLTSHQIEKSSRKIEKVENKTRKPSRRKLSEAEIQERITEALSKNEDKTKFRLIVIAGRYVCNACGKIFNNLQTLKFYHWKTVHAGNVYVCDICGKVLKSIRCKKSHNLRIHGTEEEKNKWKIPCEICNVLVYKYEMKLHMSQSHREGPRMKHKCEQCGVEYLNKHSLSEHMIVHVQGPIKCDICSKAFSTSRNLKQHIFYVHTDKEKTFSCDKCPMKFCARDILKRHQLTHEEDRQFVCEECGKSFKYPDHFSRHLKCHKEIEEKGEGAFTCEVCNDGKTFKHSLSLYKHKIRMHSHSSKSPKIYQCSFCGKRLSSTTTLRTHENMHRELPGFKPRIRQKLPGHMIHGKSEEVLPDTQTKSVAEDFLTDVQ